MQRSLTSRFAPVLALLGVMCGAACSGVDLHDNPVREVPKQTGPLTSPPQHLSRGGE